MTASRTRKSEDIDLEVEVRQERIAMIMIESARDAGMNTATTSGDEAETDTVIVIGIRGDRACFHAIIMSTDRSSRLSIMALANDQAVELIERFAMDHEISLHHIGHYAMSRVIHSLHSPSNGKLYIHFT